MGVIVIYLYLKYMLQMADRAIVTRIINSYSAQGELSEDLFDHFTNVKVVKWPTLMKTK